MVRRPLRPTFALNDCHRLIALLRETEHLIGVCSSAEKYGSPLQAECQSTVQAVRSLTVTLTGDEKQFDVGFVVRPRASSPFDELATAVFNALHTRPGYEPIENLDDLRWEGLDNAVRDWRVIRAALETIPPDVVTRLAKIQTKE